MKTRSANASSPAPANKTGKAKLTYDRLINRLDISLLTVFEKYPDEKDQARVKALENAIKDAMRTTQACQGRQDDSNPSAGKIKHELSGKLKEINKQYDACEEVTKNVKGAPIYPNMIEDYLRENFVAEAGVSRVRVPTFSVNSDDIAKEGSIDCTISSSPITSPINLVAPAGLTGNDVDQIFDKSAISPRMIEAAEILIDFSKQQPPKVSAVKQSTIVKFPANPSSTRRANAPLTAAAALSQVTSAKGKEHAIEPVSLPTSPIVPAEASNKRKRTHDDDDAFGAEPVSPKRTRYGFTIPESIDFGNKTAEEIYMMGVEACLQHLRHNMDQFFASCQ